VKSCRLAVDEGGAENGRRKIQLRYVFSPLPVSGGGGGGAAGLQTVAVRGGLLAGAISFFFGFFFSRPLLSRLPIALSSHE
jgi:hypothetical protein